MIGLIGGAAAVLWAMRDRLISIAAPAEPEPPRFRVVSPPQEMPSTDSVTDDLTRVSGIGPVFAARLRAAGIDSFAKLADSDDATLAEIADVPHSRVEGWREQAARF
jgi:predicted flap endonuclease-1-like 5' DNA nuclease